MKVVAIQAAKYKSNKFEGSGFNVVQQHFTRYWNKNIRLAGPGTYARTIPNELLVKIMNDPKQKAEFLEFCYEYDRNPYVCGMGKDNLFAYGEIV